MGGLSHGGWRLICLKGNHEDIMWQSARRGLSLAPAAPVI